MRLPARTTCAALAALALACRTELGQVRDAPALPATSSNAALMDSAPDSLGLELVLPRRVRAGEPVPITLRVQNQTQRTLDLYLRGRAITFDVLVARLAGEIVWRRLEDEIIPAIVHLRTLAPGERLEAEALWQQRTKQGRRVQPGEYTVRALLLTEGDPLETPPAPFRIVEP